jgi:acetolactate decarboxylase
MKNNLLLCFGFLVLLVGCATPPSPWRETVTQVSTYDALKAGRYDGQMAISNLLVYGDTGLGTFDGLNGEMVVVSGVVYQVTYDGQVVVAPPEARAPFACVTWFAPDATFDSGPMSYKVFQNTMKWKNRLPDYVQAVQIRGAFKRIHYRSVPAQAQPYPALEKVVAESQQTWTREGVEGVLVGFYFPPSFSGIAPTGYHLHFLSADRTVGGHVLDFELEAGRIELDATPVVQLFLPPPSREKAP